MRAITVPTPGGPESLVLADVKEPVCRPGEVVVRVRATAVNRADLLQAAGKYPAPPGESEILGLEAAGIVEGTGEAVCFLLPGGGYAERVNVHRGLLMPIPSNLSFEEAASIPEAWFTAYLNLFMEASLRRGEKVLLHAAASGVGTAAIQLCRRHGVWVGTTVRTSSKMQGLKELGADLVVDTSQADFAVQVESACGRDSIDVVLDPVGGTFFPMNLRVMARGGRLVQIATMAGARTEIDLRLLMSKRLRLIGSTLRARPLDEKISLTHEFTRKVLPGFASGVYKPLVDSVFPLERAGDAHRRVAENLNSGKVVLSVSA